MKNKLEMTWFNESPGNLRFNITRLRLAKIARPMNKGKIKNKSCGMKKKRKGKYIIVYLLH